MAEQNLSTIGDIDKNNSSQRRFKVMSDNLFKIVNKLIKNKKVCRLLKYQNSMPLSPALPEVDGIDLLNKQIVIVPKVPENDDKECSFIIVVFDKYVVNPQNADFKLSTLRFEIVCPYEEWLLDESNLRPYMLMQEIDDMFNQEKISGMGKLQFSHCVPLTLSPQMGGYTMYYNINEFN